MLVAVGGKPYTEGLGLESVGLKTDKRGRVEVDAHFRSAAPGIYAIGDVIAGPMLAHKAEDEGVACVEFIATGYGHVNYDAIPGVVYTHPEIASVGKTEEELKEAGDRLQNGQIPLPGQRPRQAPSADRRPGQNPRRRQNRPRARSPHHRPPSGRPDRRGHPGDRVRASSEDIARTCHAHPTLAEVVKEAALSVDGRPLNI